MFRFAPKSEPRCISYGASVRNGRWIERHPSPRSAALALMLRSGMDHRSFNGRSAVLILVFSLICNFSGCSPAAPPPTGQPSSQTRLDRKLGKLPVTSATAPASSIPRK